MKFKFWGNNKSKENVGKSPQEIYDEKIREALLLVAKHLGIQRLSITNGGPSISDPCGFINKCIGISDGVNGFWCAINDDGKVVCFGARLDGKSYEIHPQQTSL